LVPGPVLVQIAFTSQPPCAVWHELAGVQTVPVPVYPKLQAQVAVPGPVEVQAAVSAHPPLLTAHESIPVHVVPSPV
jgi:hypothetical protein